MSQYAVPFITLEGVDGAGKSSHMATILAALEPLGFQVVLTKEPGGTPLAEELRTLLKQTQCQPITELMLAFGSRAEHLAQVIEPSLAEGKIVISDRFTDSTYAYQGGGAGVPFEKIQALETMVHGHLQPNLTLFFDLPVEVAEARRNNRRVDTNDNQPDKFDDQDRAFFGNVRNAYLARVDADPSRFRVIDGAQTLEQVAEQVKEVVQQFAQEWVQSHSPARRSRPRP